MKYIIKCPYCDKTYTVNVSGKETDFICTSCGGANGIKDVVKQVATPQILSGRGKKDPVTETNIDTIKSFDMGEHKVQNHFVRNLIIVIIAVGVAVYNGAVMYKTGNDLWSVCILSIVMAVVFGFRIMYDVETSSIEHYGEEKKNESESLEDEMNPWYSELLDEDEEFHE